MSTVFKAFVSVVVAFLLLIVLLFVRAGEWQGALTTVFFLAVVGFFVGVGWFVISYPVPPDSQGGNQSFWSAVRRYKEHYPGWQGKLVFYGLPTLWVLVIITKLIAFLDKT